MNMKMKSIGILGALGLATLAFTACSTDSGDDTKVVVADSLHVSGNVLRLQGDTVFHNTCAMCHGADGEGAAGPQLANSDFFMNHRQVVINLVLRGNLSEPHYLDTLRVNGIFYNGGGMPSWASTLSNREIASVLTYLRSVKNDTLRSNCQGAEVVTCTNVARTPAAMLADTVAVWEVKAVRDSLLAAHIIEP